MEIQKLSKEEIYFKQVSFNDDFDCVADIGRKDVIYLKLVRNLVNNSDEHELNTNNITDKPTQKEQNQCCQEKDREIAAYEQSHKINTEQFMELAAHAKDLELTIAELREGLEFIIANSLDVHLIEQKAKSLLYKH